MGVFGLVAGLGIRAAFVMAVGVGVIFITTMGVGEVGDDVIGGTVATMVAVGVVFPVVATVVPNSGVGCAGSGLVLVPQATSKSSTVAWSMSRVDLSSIVPIY